MDVDHLVVGGPLVVEDAVDLAAAAAEVEAVAVVAATAAGM